MDLDAADTPVITNSSSSMGKQSVAQEEKEGSPDQASTTLDIRSSGDEGKGNTDSGETPDGMTPTQQLFYAADKGDCDLIRSAIQRGADVKVHDMGPKVQAEEKRAAELAAGKKKTKKQLAAEEKEQESMFRDIPITEDTALHKAAEKGHLPAVDLLFYAEADIEAKNRLGSTPLHRAVSAKQPEVVAALLKHGARLEAVNAIGNTALHIASYQGDLEMAQLLITHAKHEAYRAVVAVNQAGVTPIDYARKKQMHTLLSSYRLLSSATSSFIRHPLGDHPTDGTPKHGRMLIPHVSGNADTAPQLSRPGSWKTLQDDSRQTSAHKDEHGRAGELLHPVHHHAPNPPISGHHASPHPLHPVEQHGPSSHQTPSISSRPLQPSGEHEQNGNNTIKATTPAATNNTSGVPIVAILHPSPSQPASTSSTSDSATTFSAFPPTLKLVQPSTTSSSEQLLLTKPSFEKTSSLDSHPEMDSDRRQGSISTVGQIVSPVLAARGAEGAAGSSLSVDPGARGVSMAGLSLNMLPNECEPREEEEKSG